MGFSQEKTRHHFSLETKGGVIEVFTVDVMAIETKGERPSTSKADCKIIRSRRLLNSDSRSRPTATRNLGDEAAPIGHQVPVSRDR
jgi:hypothetical protein